MSLKEPHNSNQSKKQIKILTILTEHFIMMISNLQN